MKRFLAPLIAFSSALSTHSAFAMLCPEMFSEKGINGYEKNESRTKYEVRYSTEPNKKDPNTIYSDFSNWKLCKTAYVKDVKPMGVEIYCNGRLLFDGAYFLGIFAGSWIDKNGGKWETNYNQIYSWNPPKNCSRGSYQGMASYYYSDTVKYGYSTYIQRLREHWAFTVKETRYYEAIPRPEF